MENTPGKMHPLMMVAAISVTAASLAVIGVATGLIPGRQSAAPAPTEVATTPTRSTALGAPATTAAPTEVPPAPPKKAASHPPHESAHRQPPPPPPVAGAMAPFAPPAPPAPPICRECGTVESVREVVQQGQGTGLGVVAGGILGGVLGHQVGAGRGKDLATVAGAVGGAVAGHQIEKSQRKNVHYEITVRMDDGTTRAISAATQPSWRGGERVRVISGAAVPL